MPFPGMNKLKYILLSQGSEETISATHWEWLAKQRWRIWIGAGSNIWCLICPITREITKNATRY